MDELAEDVGVLLGEAEHLHDHAHRDVLRVVDRGVDLVLARGRVEQLAAELARERLVLGDRPSARTRAAAAGGRSAWNGGSDVIGGATPIGAGRSFSPGRISLTTTERDVKCSVS